MKESIPQEQWATIFEASDYTPRGVEIQFGVPWKTVSFWLYGKWIGPDDKVMVKPSKKYQEKANNMINEISKSEPMKRHPSFGYATEAQVKRLNEIGIGPERDQILAEIQVQTKNKGKRK